MSEKIYHVESTVFGEAWVVRSATVKGAIVETLAHLKPRLEIMESVLQVDLELDLKVKELKEVVSDLGRIPYKYHV